MTRELHRRLDRLERATGADAPNIRVFFEPRPCDDPSGFARQCEAEAGGAQVFVVRFVKPPAPSIGPMQ